MDPQITRGAFRLAFLVAFVALVTLPFQDRSSAEFVVTVMALAVGTLFIAAVVLVMRWSAPRLPEPSDKRRRKEYNKPRSREADARPTDRRE